MIDLRNSINSKKIDENENLKKVVSIVEKILDFNTQQRGKEHPSDLNTHAKISTPKKMIQKLPVVLTQVKAGDTLESLLK